MNRRHSFTLLEIIIAVSIFLMVAVTLYVYSSGTTNSWKKVMAEKKKFSELLALDRAIDGILSTIVPFTWPDQEDEDKSETPFLVADSKYLRCACLHRLNDADEGALRFGEFILENGRLLFVYSDRPFLSWEQVGDRQWSTVLAEGVSEINFRYADWNDEDTDDWNTRLIWQEEWETEDSGRLDVPLAIMMEVTWTDGRVESWFRRTMGNGYRERYGKWEAQNDEE